MIGSLDGFTNILTIRIYENDYYLHSQYYIRISLYFSFTKKFLRFVVSKFVKLSWWAHHMTNIVKFRIRELINAQLVIGFRGLLMKVLKYLLKVWVFGCNFFDPIVQYIVWEKSITEVWLITQEVTPFCTYFRPSSNLLLCYWTF